MNQCEVADCNGNGYCVDGSCQCRSGFKGEHCEVGRFRGGVPPPGVLYVSVSIGVNLDDDDRDRDIVHS